MKLVHAFGRVYDLFDGEGWEAWTRLSVHMPEKKGEGKPTFLYVDGRPLTKDAINRLNANFQYKVHYQNV